MEGVARRQIFGRSGRSLSLLCCLQLSQSHGDTCHGKGNVFVPHFFGSFCSWAHFKVD